MFTAKETGKLINNPIMLKYNNPLIINLLYFISNVKKTIFGQMKIQSYLQKTHRVKWHP